MKQFVLLFILFSLNCGAIQAQGVKFETGTWAEMLKKAKVANKIIFVDVYTTWCVPCKIVSEKVFPQEKMGEYYNANFINYKIDAESEEGKEFVKTYPVKGYPTFMYIDSTGTLICKLLGAKDVDEFINQGKSIPVYLRYGGQEKMEATIRNGMGNSALLYDNYLMATEKEKPKALNLYLNSLTDEQLSDVDNSLLDEISLYDKGLMTRMVEGIVRMSNAQKTPITRTLMIRAVIVQHRISLDLSQSIEDGNINLFNELLELKGKFSGFKGDLLDGDVNVRKHRLFHATPEFLQLAYWAKNRVEEKKFAENFDSYMKKMIKDNPLESFKDGFIDRALEVAKQIGDQPQASTYVYDLVTYKQFVTNELIGWVDYFWRISPSDNTTKSLCYDWVQYLIKINNYNPVAPLLAAELLNRIGYEKEAIATIKNAIDFQKEIKSTDAKVKREMEFLHQDLVNRKK